MLLQDLKRTIADGDAVLVLGTGVTMATTGNAPSTSWRGLIEGGLDRVVGLGLRDEAWRGRALETLRHGDLEDLIGVAQQVESRLRRAREFATWLDLAVGGLEIVDDRLYRAIANTLAPVATTNYDLLGETALSRGSISWNNHLDVAAWLRMEDARRPFFHLHGLCGDVDSIVLGQSSYQTLGSDLHAQFVQKVLAATRSFVFIGCGAGLEDPNVGALIRWLSESYAAATGPRHYRLCTDAEATVLREATRPGDRVFPIAYGTSHHDLAPFVAAHLAHPTRIVPPELVGFATAYDGLTNAAYPGPERWTRKDEIFRQMRAHPRVAGIDLDALESFGTTGFQVVAIAAMAAEPRDEHLPRLEAMARRRPPINVAYKIADFARAYVSGETTVEANRAEALAKMIGLLEQCNAQDAGFRAYARETRAIFEAKRA